MASRKEQKEQARARREEQERVRAAAARRQRRIRSMGGIVVLVVAVVAVLIAVSSSGGSSGTGLQKGKSQTQTVAAVQKLLGGVPQSGATLGSPSAPVTMTYYGDLECPICRDFTLSGGLAPLIANEVRSGKVKIVYKSFQTATKDPTVFKTQQTAALAAGQQQRFWNFAELFYREQGAEGTGYVNETYLTGLAKQIPGFNLTKWTSDRGAASLAAQVTSDEQAGLKIGVQGTPTLIMTGPKGNAVPQTGSDGISSYSDLQAAYKKVA